MPIGRESRSKYLGAGGSYAGCGSVGRSHGGGSRSASCGRTTRPVSTGWTATTRPGSAKDWVLQCQEKRAQEETRKLKWENTNTQFKANQFHANFFNATPSAPR